MKENIVIENALKIIAAKICGNNLAYKIDFENNQAQIVAVCNGVFVASEDRVFNFNNFFDKVIINTVFPYSVVFENQVVAVVEVDDAINNKNIDEVVFAISGNVDMLKIVELKKQKIAIVAEGDDNNKHLLDMIKKIKLNLSFLDGCEYKTVFCKEEDVDNALYLIEKEKYDNVFLLSAKKNKPFFEEIMQKTLNNIICKKMPEVGLSDFVVGVNKKIKMFSLPYNYALKNTFNIDNIVNKIILSDDVIENEAVLRGPVMLADIKKLDDKEVKDLITPQNSKNDKKIAAIVLAAGTSSRAEQNKLLIDVGGKPLFLKSIEEAIKAGISPITVVLGYKYKAMEGCLKGLDVNVVINEDYLSGVKSSIALGIKAVPSFSDAVMLIPADMPNLTKEHFLSMIKAFDIKKEKQLIMSSYKGRGQNPVLWSKSLFEYADVAPEKTELRDFFISHKDYTTLIEVEEESLLLDVTFPADCNF